MSTKKLKPIWKLSDFELEAIANSERGDKP